MFLVEVYDNSGKLFKRRVTDRICKVEEWVNDYLVPKCCPYDRDYRLSITVDNYGNGEVIYNHTDYEYAVVFTITTTNIGTI